MKGNVVLHWIALMLPEIVLQRVVEPKQLKACGTVSAKRPSEIISASLSRQRRRTRHPAGAAPVTVRTAAPFCASALQHTSSRRLPSVSFRRTPR